MRVLVGEIAQPVGPKISPFNRAGVEVRVSAAALARALAEDGMDLVPQRRRDDRLMRLRVQAHVRLHAAHGRVTATWAAFAADVEWARWAGPTSPQPLAIRPGSISLLADPGLFSEQQSSSMPRLIDKDVADAPCWPEAAASVVPVLGETSRPLRPTPARDIPRPLRS